MSFRNKIIARVEEKLYSTCAVCEVDGLKIVDMRDKNDGYVESITSSLEMIKIYDPKRYKRVLSEASWIVNTNEVGTYGGQYKRRTKSCILNFDNFDEDQRLVSAYFGGMIVHEATHGLMDTKGIHYTHENKVQIERICSAEENRFYRRIVAVYPEYEGRLVRVFDSSDWEESWGMSKWEKAFHSFKRIMRD